MRSYFAWLPVRDLDLVQTMVARDLEGPLLLASSSSSQKMSLMPDDHDITKDHFCRSRK